MMEIDASGECRVSSLGGWDLGARPADENDGYDEYGNFLRVQGCPLGGQSFGPQCVRIMEIEENENNSLGIGS